MVVGAPPVLKLVIVEVVVARLMNAGDPASWPLSSPVCHWRQRNQAGSRTCAAKLGPKSFDRGRGSSRCQKVTDGLAMFALGQVSPSTMLRISCKKLETMVVACRLLAM